MKLALLLVLGASVVTAQTNSLSSLVDRYFDDYFRLNPTAATAAGFHHPYDSQLEDYSTAGTQAQIAMDQKYLREFSALPVSDDRDWVISHIKGDLLNLQNIRQQETNPDVYSSGPTASIFTLISRKFAPPEERLRSVIAREKKIPQVLQDARSQIRNPPRIYTEVALEQLSGNESFFANDVPAAFTEVKDPNLLREFSQTNNAAID